MRPVLLTMEGFASFRDEARLDFRGVDYFALVGRTGAGKSTVIDAITFALYGTADRWGRANGIRDALAPTANQAKVSLVFDASGHRYVIARELRRTAQGVQQKAVSLEVLADPAGVGGTDEEPGQILATTPGGAKSTITALLGLGFDEFTKCVVLPQGKFSEFLVSDPPLRRQILGRLLGEHRYTAMCALAKERAAEAGGALGPLTAQLDQLSDLSDAAITALEDRYDQLAAGAVSLADTVGHLDGALRVAADTAAAVTATSQQLGELDVSVLDGVSALDQEHGLAVQAYADADTTALAAVAATKQVRAQQQGTLSVDRAAGLLEDHRQLAETAALLPKLAEAAARAQKVHTAQQQLSDQADLALDRARAARDAADRTLQEASQRVLIMRSSLELLRLTKTPDTLAGLVVDVAAAEAAAHAARLDLDAANAEVRAGQAERVDPGRLLRAGQLVDRAREAGLRAGSLAELEERGHTLRDALAQATRARDAAHLARRELNEKIRQCSMTATAADLRAELHPGGTCPVCDQAVATVPAAPAVESEQVLLTGRVPAHDTAVRETDESVRAAEAAAGQLDLRIELLRSQVGEDQRVLGGVDLSSEAALLERDRQHAERLGALVEQADIVRGTVEAAAGRRNALAVQEGEARRHLRSELQRVARLDPPAVDDDDLTSAWGTLAAWADRLSGEFAATIDTAAETAARADADRTTHRDSHSAAKAAADAARDATRLAHHDLVEAEQRLRITRANRDSLHDKVADRADAEQAQVLLDLAVELADALDRAVRSDEAAQTVLQAARQAAERVGRRVQTARDQLDRRRDPLVALGAPVLTGETLLERWSELTTWAGSLATQLRTELTASRTRLLQLSDDVAVDVAALLGQLTDAGLETGGIGPAWRDTAETATQLAAAAPALMAAAVADADRAFRTAVADRSDRSRLAAEIKEVRERQAVAAQLGNLLSPAQFEKWLTNTVMARLVSDASATLYELSGQQFTLSYDDRSEFVVVDHSDGMSSRSVKTLSGGETFQASLALALALSSHMAALAAGGTSTLGSIFLDEGFGTLDPDALAVVADSLAQLAAGDRLVGIVTHVAELAETVPHRFVVERDSRTSTLRKES